MCLLVTVVREKVSRSGSHAKIEFDPHVKVPPENLDVDPGLWIFQREFSTQQHVSRDRSGVAVWLCTKMRDLHRSSRCYVLSDRESQGTTLNTFNGP